MSIIVALLYLFNLLKNANASYQYPKTGFATMTHYDLPLNDVAACGCTGQSTHYPTAALSSLAYGSTDSYGPACGVCFNLTLLNTFTSNPPFFPSTHPSVVVKITDECPAISEWCNATLSKPNPGGHIINFDLAFPSPAGAIPSNFFPQNVSEYGYSDFGVWNISYEVVTCDPNWAGHSDLAALGSVPSLGDGVCCPAEVTASNICPSFSEDSGTKPPDTGSTGNGIAPHLSKGAQIAIAVVVLVVGLMGGYYSFLLFKSWRRKA